MHTVSRQMTAHAGLTGGQSALHTVSKADDRICVIIWLSVTATYHIKAKDSLQGVVQHVVSTAYLGTGVVKDAWLWLVGLY